MNEESHRNLQQIIAHAIFTPTFRSRLLNGSRPQAISEFEMTHPALSTGERETILAIPQADNLVTFAQGLIHQIHETDAIQPRA